MILNATSHGFPSSMASRISSCWSLIPFIATIAFNVKLDVDANRQLISKPVVNPLKNAQHISINFASLIMAYSVVDKTSYAVQATFALFVA